MSDKLPKESNDRADAEERKKQRGNDALFRTMTADEWVRLQNILGKSATEEEPEDDNLSFDELPAEGAAKMRAASASQPNSMSQGSIPTLSHANDSSHSQQMMSVAVSALQEGDELKGSYRLIKALATGKLGTVYAVEHTRFGGRYAVKILHQHLLQSPQQLQAIFRAIRSTERMNHPGIVRPFLLDHDDALQAIFYFMDFVPGNSLAHVLANRTGSEEHPPFSATALLAFVEALLAPLRYAHQRELICRNLHPSHILKTDDAQTPVRLLNFGFPIQVSHTGGSPISSSALNDLYYAAPELRTPGQPVTAATDIFSLGVLLYQMLTGILPVGIAQPPSRLYPIWPSSVDVVVGKATQANWQDRYQSTDAFFDALASALNKRTTLATPSTSPQDATGSIDSSINRFRSVITPSATAPSQIMSGASRPSREDIPSTRPQRTRPPSHEETNTVGRPPTLFPISDKIPTNTPLPRRTPAGPSTGERPTTGRRPAGPSTGEQPTTSRRPAGPSTGERPATGRPLGQTTSERAAVFPSLHGGPPLQPTGAMHPSHHLRNAPGTLPLHPTGAPMNAPMSGPINAPMNAPMSAPTGGPTGGPFGGPMSGPMPAIGSPMPAIGSPMSGPIGSPMPPMGSQPIGYKANPMGHPKGGSTSGQSHALSGAPILPPLGAVPGPMAGPPLGAPGGSPGGPTLNSQHPRRSPSGAPPRSSPDPRQLQPRQVPTQPMVAWQAHEQTITSFCLSPDGKFLATAGQDNTLKIWAAGSWSLLYNLHINAFQLSHLQWSHNSRYIAFANDDDDVEVWDLQTQQRVHLFSPNCRTISIAWNPNGHHLYTANEDSHISIWHLALGRQSGRMTGHQGAVNALYFVHGQEWLVSGGDDPIIRLWNVTNKQLQKELCQTSAPTYALAMSPQADRIATGHSDGSVQLFSFPQGKAQATLLGHEGTIRSLAFAPNNAWIASASHDSNIKLWDLQLHNQIGTITHHKSPVHSIAIHPTGRWMISASNDTEIAIWDVSRL